jgi:oligo-1,6-glucosidase
MYQGQELGLVNIPKGWGIKEYKDVAAQNWFHKCVSFSSYRKQTADGLDRILAKRRRETGKEEVDMSDIMHGLSMKARDNARVPMQVS